MADIELRQNQQLPAATKTKYVDFGDGTHGLKVATQSSADAPYIEPTPITYGAIQVSAMGNGASAQIVPTNTNRRGLIITNVSDTTGYLSIGDNAVTSTNYTFILNQQETLIFEEPITTQAIWAADVSAADKNLVYQEGV